MVSKPGKAMTAVAVVFVALTIIMAGLFVYEYSGLNAENKNYTSLESTLTAQQKSIVLNDSYAHWESIAIQSLSGTSSQYANNATLYWIGGPLNGTYNNQTQINTTWKMFFNMWTDIWYHADSSPTVQVNNGLINVSANIQFIGPKSTNTSQYRVVNVSYELTYQNMGSNFTNGSPDYMIHSEVFHLEGKSTINMI